ncbi:Nucleoside-diphosphate-sugar epimerases [hydrothermal vent metagenome]|uniref:Nucleoside-diphosphate-sugar epimerases n=1 Tax=hydrothermal vent metagenome TaxID=652676 RepID=A0A3B0SUD6_9ZZZZ
MAKVLVPEGWTIYGTVRNSHDFIGLEESGVTPILWSEGMPEAAFAQASHVLISTAPGTNGDPVLKEYKNKINEIAGSLSWIGYLSTTGVYGDHQGGWVDEATALTPATERGKLRVAAENQWKSMGSLPLHIFRLAGIYGPGRGPVEKLRNGTARRIVKENQVFSRIHVEDIAQVLKASMANPSPGAVYNVCDNDPAPPQDVIGYAAKLLGVEVPPEIPFENAGLSPIARSFYAESKRVRNDRILKELGITLRYPTYRDGLTALLRGET